MMINDSNFSLKPLDVSIKNTSKYKNSKFTTKFFVTFPINVWFIELFEMRVFYFT